MNIHEKYINRCIEIAKNGLGSTRPNPMVGCVIVLNDCIIGEGFTSAYGGNHAEVNAIASVKDQSLLNGATLYVTLEPCSHFGKTPPCSDLIIKHQIPNVVIGIKDINNKVAGKGIEKLIKSGCQVTVGVLEDQCKEHHKRFFTFHNKKRPYIILKWAQTQDGFIAPLTKDKKEPVWISNVYSRQLTHKWRTEEQAIMVGVNTILQDNPSLTARDWKGQNPLRVVLDKNEMLSKDYNVFNNKAGTLLIKESDAEAICKKLYQNNIISVIVEGGAKTLQLFINSNIWDEARIFTGNVEFGEGIKAPLFSGKLISEKHIEKDVLKIYFNN
ncbi:bifunctional diaminohydroxyphosphoribosylaminopyrimidine deaminase/5-amino-6-(5-phosphoribosylamino)uracil reductase RibD [Yeosuana sp. MJ-SS3]|uniref:Riboflavin biosynthesis protein RibD n=1 Tax=Gilvirhabdus luticola TaxID=3079858 RepID=A0ABU3UA83_9FLAO|nr:bifunctional diaminohydroxyphosphoribosylaminopyrimidine deaminase/5-amino-6-(5-phosphoribosylamino)uracil reductase RibD [Yeosuana sp. MJ-SS3]MDU8887319.1 bifunctional diaminohydroxyphosphoribosylaminopyrimidine deaminase/5-amino-6-(5-phosphoribosylamino)uracil reductase RibD [Yeosuana sp. MJ-SS3]